MTAGGGAAIFSTGELENAIMALAMNSLAETDFERCRQDAEIKRRVRYEAAEEGKGGRFR